MPKKRRTSSETSPSDESGDILTSLPTPKTIKRSKSQMYVRTPSSSAKLNRFSSPAALTFSMVTPKKHMQLVRKLSFTTKDAQTPSRYIDRHRAIRPLQVFLRLRPLLPSEETTEETDNFVIDDDTQTISLTAPPFSQTYKNGERKTKYTFSKIFGPNKTQKAVFDEAALPMVDELFTGQNGLIFAYGITNSGKTYTMQGTQDRPGIIPRVMKYVFDRIAKDKRDSDNFPFTVTASFLEIYNEKVYDLLNITRKQGKVCKLQNGGGEKDEVFVCGLKEVKVNSHTEAYAVLKQGQKNRKVCGTTLNQDSSRSHSVFTVKLIREDGQVWSRLSVVDLAGSERVRRTKTTGERLKEAVKINTSLMSLGRCLEALRYNQMRKAGEKKKQIPFRDSAVTRLFKDSLCGWGHTVMITNAAPRAEDYDETIHALKYAAIARQIRIKSRIDTKQKKALLNQKRQAEKPLPLLEEDVDANEDSAGDLSEGDDDEVDDLLDEVYELKKQLVASERKLVQIECEVREEVCSEMEEQMQEMEQMWKQRMEKDRALTEAKYSKKIALWKTEACGNIGNVDMQEVLEAKRMEHDSYLNQLRKDYEARVSTLKANLTKQVANNKDLEETLKDRHKQQQEAVAEHDTRNMFLMEKVAEMTIQLRELEDELKSTTETHKTALNCSNEKIVIAEKKITKLIEEKELAEADKNDLKEEMQVQETALKKEVKKLSKEAKDWKLKYDEASKSTKSLKEKQKASKSSQKTLDKEMAKLLSEINIRNIKIGQLTDELQEGKQLLEERDAQIVSLKAMKEEYAKLAENYIGNRLDGGETDIQKESANTSSDDRFSLDAFEFADEDYEEEVIKPKSKRSKTKKAKKASKPKKSKSKSKTSTNVKRPTRVTRSRVAKTDALESMAVDVSDISADFSDDVYVDEDNVDLNIESSKSITANTEPAEDVSIPDFKKTRALRSTRRLSDCMQDISYQDIMGEGDTISYADLSDEEEKQEAVTKKDGEEEDNDSDENDENSKPNVTENVRSTRTHARKSSNSEENAEPAEPNPPVKEKKTKRTKKGPRRKQQAAKTKGANNSPVQTKKGKHKRTKAVNTYSYGVSEETRDVFETEWMSMLTPPASAAKSPCPDSVKNDQENENENINNVNVPDEMVSPKKRTKKYGLFERVRKGSGDKNDEETANTMISPSKIATAGKGVLTNMGSLFRLTPSKNPVNKEKKSAPTPVARRLRSRR